jgi:dUTP pyrophosphatase
MILSNGTGTVDEGYTNEISAVFYHVMPNMPRYKVGDKIAQMKIGTTYPIEFNEVEELDKTERGMNGYGSSGK